MAIAYLCLGTNSGDRARLVEQAVNFLNLADGIKIIRTSALYETEPWGVKEQNWFLNIAVEIKTSLSPQDLMVKCLNIEQMLGRNREKETRWGERPIDIDIIFYDNALIDSQILTLPHPRMHLRAFVLVPLLELVPDFVHPVLNKTISQIYDELADVEDVCLYGTRSNG